MYSLHKRKDKTLVDVEELHSVWLKDDANFNYLKGQIINWNKEIESCEAHKIRRIEFRNKLYQELSYHLLQIVNSKNRLNQQKFLQDVKFWYEMQLSLLSKNVKTLEPTKFVPNSAFKVGDQTLDE